MLSHAKENKNKSKEKKCREFLPFIRRDNDIPRLFQIVCDDIGIDDEIKLDTGHADQLVPRVGEKQQTIDVVHSYTVTLGGWNRC